jgi:hypothetical protein
MSIAAARSHGGAQPRRVRARVESMLGIAASWRGGCSAERTSRPPGHAALTRSAIQPTVCGSSSGPKLNAVAKEASPASRSASSR